MSCIITSNIKYVTWDEIKTMCDKNLKIGLFGGSFDPPHFGHLGIARDACSIFALDLLIWSITPQNTTKPKAHHSVQARVSMISDIIAQHQNMVVSTFECHFLIFNTWQTIKLFNDSGYRPLFIMGSDSLWNINRWEKWEYIVDNANLAVFARKGFPFCNKYIKDLTMLESEPSKHTFIEKTWYDISSTEIRLGTKNRSGA